MKIFTRLALLMVLSCVVLQGTRAAVIVSAESKTVIGSKDQSTIAFIELFVRNDDPLLMLSAFQLHVEVDTPLMFYTADNTEDHVQLLKTAPFIQQNTSTKILAAKLGADPVVLTDNGGLARLAIAIPENTLGNFPIRVVSLEQDPDFGTALTGDANAPLPLPITTANGMLSVVPEPAGVLVIGVMSMACLERRRKRSGIS